MCLLMLLGVKEKIRAVGVERILPRPVVLWNLQLVGQLDVVVVEGDPLVTAADDGDVVPLVRPRPDVHNHGIELPLHE